jgi:hypothetical protein
MPPQFDGGRKYLRYEMASLLGEPFLLLLHRLRATLKGQPGGDFFPLRFVRIEPYVVPKKSLTGDNTERVDTRVLQVIYAVDTQGKRLFVGQQLDVFIDATQKVSPRRRLRSRNNSW